ncbi:hypothetical protein RDWZM_008767 [Blomia tropicalis]|uniref:Uncharacterized protein n=1 Tax=Blomia tropicalis TaxID=40697 RepID=A0A9Q0M584_BLOTA|nr:hypothetical protein RDWZM_008767 [Blomia tropicalis]
MKFFIAFSVAMIASASATYVAPAVGYAAGIVNTGSSAVSRSDDGFGNYAFGYNEDHATGGTFRKEQGGPGVQVGSYGLRDADGRVRTVNYVADALGFRASVQTNEPGVDPLQAPAAASVNGAVAAVPAHVVAPAVHAAPVVHAAPIAASYAVKTHHAAIAAPAVAVAAPVASGYSVATHHASVAPVVAAAPAVAVAAPVASGYSVSTHHASVAPVVAAAPAVAVAAPVASGYSVSTHHASVAPVVAAAPAYAVAKPVVAGYSVATHHAAVAPVVAAPVAYTKTYAGLAAPYGHFAKVY